MTTAPAAAVTSSSTTTTVLWTMDNSKSDNSEEFPTDNNNNNTNSNQIKSEQESHWNQTSRERNNTTSTLTIPSSEEEDSLVNRSTPAIPTPSTTAASADAGAMAANHHDAVTATTTTTKPDSSEPETQRMCQEPPESVPDSDHAATEHHNDPAVFSSSSSSSTTTTTAARTCCGGCVQHKDDPAGGAVDCCGSGVAVASAHGNGTDHQENHILGMNPPHPHYHHPITRRGGHDNDTKPAESTDSPAAAAAHTNIAAEQRPSFRQQEAVLQSPSVSLLLLLSGQPEQSPADLAVGPVVVQNKPLLLSSLSSLPDNIATTPWQPPPPPKEEQDNMLPFSPPVMQAKQSIASHRLSLSTTTFANPWVTKARLQTCVHQETRQYQETIQTIYHQARQQRRRHHPQPQQQQQQQQQEPQVGQTWQSSSLSSTTSSSSSSSSSSTAAAALSSSSSTAGRTVILLSGPSGCGKRSLPQLALQELVEQEADGGYFLQGHYDSTLLPEHLDSHNNNSNHHQSNGSPGGTVIPYSGIVMAFSSFAAQVWERSCTDDHHHNAITRLRQAILEQFANGGREGCSSPAAATATATATAPDSHTKNNNKVNVSVLTSMIPALEVILGECGCPSSSSSSSSPSSHDDPIQRFVFAFRLFLRAIASVSDGGPLVLVLHDLHYADACSLDLLTGMVTDWRHNNLLLIATCDDSKVRPDSYLARKLREMEQQHAGGAAATTWSRGIHICNIAVPTVSSELELRSWLGQALCMTNADHAETVLRLTRLVQRHCGMDGNWFLIMEFIQFLQESDLLLYRERSSDTTAGRWELASPEELDVVLANMDKPGDFLVEKFNQHLTPDTKRVLTVAACLGSFVDVELLGYILNNNNNEQNQNHNQSLQDSLDELVQLGLLARNKDLNPRYCGLQICRSQKKLHHQGFTFEHTVIREAAHALIARGGSSHNSDTHSNSSSSTTITPESLHLEIGRRLWKKLSSRSDEELSHHVFVVLSQLYLGRHLIVKEKERVATATLCLLGGRRAAKSSTFRTAAVYLRMGIELLYKNSSNSTGNQNTDMLSNEDDFSILHNRCWRDEYDLSLALHCAAAEATMASADFDATAQFLERILANARTFDDKFQAYATKMYALSQQDRHDECIDLGLCVLKQLGETFPNRLCFGHLTQEMRSTEKLLKHKSNEQICRLPLLPDHSPKLKALQVLNFMIIPAMAFRPKLQPFIMLRMMKITLQHGLSVLTAPAFGVYGMVCIGLYNNVQKATRFADLALVMLDRFGVMEYLPRVHAAVYGCIHSWTKPIRTAFEPLLHAHRIGMQLGDAEFGGLCANLYCFYALDTGVNLEIIRQEWNGFKESMVSAKQQYMLRMFLPTIQIVHHVMGLSGDPLASKGDVIDFDEFENMAIERGSTMGAFCIRFCRMRLGFLFGDIEMAERAAVGFEAVMQTPPTFERATYAFYIGIVAVAVARKDLQQQLGKGGTWAWGQRTSKIQRQLRDAKKAEKMLMCYARSSPHNCLDKSNLLKAELASLQGEHCKAYEKYLTAIALASENGHSFMLALSNELLARHLIRRTSITNVLHEQQPGSGKSLFRRSGSSAMSYSSSAIHDHKQKAKECLQRSIQAYHDWGGMAKVVRMQEEFRDLLGHSFTVVDEH
ncbi:hypothetical protein ACA910_004531 [Epithemia clementina (nom. ined.)]